MSTIPPYENSSSTGVDSGTWPVYSSIVGLSTTVVNPATDGFAEGAGRLGLTTERPAPLILTPAAPAHNGPAVRIPNPAATTLPTGATLGVAQLVPGFRTPPRLPDLLVLTEASAMSGLPPILDLQSDTSTTSAACGSASGVPPEEGKTPGASFTARSGRLFFNGKLIAQCFHQFGASGGITTDSAAVAEALALTLNMASAKAVTS